MKFSELLRRALKEKQMTTYQLSKCSGIPLPTISRYLNNLRQPTFENVCKIASVLSFSITYFNVNDVNYDYLFAEYGIENEKGIALIVPKSFKNYQELKRKIKEN